LSIEFAPSKISWLASKGLHHLPLIKEIVEKKEVTQAVKHAEKSLTYKCHFKVVNSQWASRALPCGAKEIQESLAGMDRSFGFMLGDFEQSKHWSRVFEYPYAVNELSHISRPGRILDCGSGLVSIQFYLAGLGFEIHSLDYDMRTLEKVSLIARKHRIEGVKPTFGSVLDLPFESGYFDGAMCISVLEHVIQVSRENSNVILSAAINELLRVLKVGAPLVLTFDVNFAKDQTDPAIAAYGLKLAQYEALCKYFGIEAEPLPEGRLFSSDTKEGSLMGENLAVYTVTIVKTMTSRHAMTLDPTFDLCRFRI
jgi:2-polyprenyl-3-methyl-5-hydroxy-6-metoxy-1,4-benzoquinol methylase